MLTLEAAKAWKAMGGPQDRWPQMTWREIESDLEYCLDAVEAGPQTNPPTDPARVTWWYAAPEDTAALDWLEREKGWNWWRQSPHGRAIPGCWFASHSDGKHLLASALDASGLVLAIYQPKWRR